ncbi:hypothetical protein [Microbacterium sp. K35]|uniref:hypothetical protein n=1 Tax=Microbacterium sp. K35 TaxID=2305440 RepID=UPI0014439FFE|nr:hypothetical protein [Microbacterium sp. K35]
MLMPPIEPLTAFLGVGSTVTCTGALRREGDSQLEIERPSEPPLPGARLRLTDPSAELLAAQDGGLVQIQATVTERALRVISARPALTREPPARFRGIEEHVPAPFDAPFAEDVANLLFSDDPPLAAEWVPLCQERHGSRHYLHYVVAYDVDTVRDRLRPFFGDDLRVVASAHTLAQVRDAHARIVRADPLNLEAVGSRLDAEGHPVLTVQTLFPDDDLRVLAASDVRALVEYSSWVRESEHRA